MSKKEPRPCEVDGEPCAFHRWVEEAKTLLKVNIMVSKIHLQQIRRDFEETKMPPPGCDLDIIRETFALVETQDGRIRKVDPESVRFTDGGMKE